MPWWNRHVHVLLSHLHSSSIQTKAILISVVWLEQKHILVFVRMAGNDRRRRRAKDQLGFSNSRSRKRVLSQLSKWQKCCLLPGNIAQSWLVQLENEHLQCAACRYSVQKRHRGLAIESHLSCSELKQKLASEEGLPLTG